jgi:high-affinity iron transporter
MIAALIIVFREIIEAGLVVGIVLAATQGVAGRGRWIAAGILGGTAGATLVACFAGVLGNAFAGTGQELFNAAILLGAVLMLGWHNVWMARHGRAVAAEMKSVGEAVASGTRTLAALAIVVGVAVLREGSEIVLFLYGVSLSGGDGAAQMALGGVIGLALGGAVSALMYFGLLRIPARRLFSVTSWLIALLAAGMAAQAVAFLQISGIVTGLAQTLWDSSRLLDASSIPGRVLHTLIGYTDRPSALELLAYVATLATIFLLMRLFGTPPRRTAAG